MNPPIPESAGRYDFKLVRGEKKELVLTFKDDEGKVADLTNSQFYLYIRSGLSPLKVFDEYSIADGRITLGNVTEDHEFIAGLNEDSKATSVLITFPPGYTAAYKSPSYKYELVRCVFESDNTVDYVRYLMLSGTIEMEANVTNLNLIKPIPVDAVKLLMEMGDSKLWTP